MPLGALPPPPPAITSFASRGPTTKLPPPPPPPPGAVGTAAADGDLQYLAGGQAELAADLGTEADGGDAAEAALRAKGEDPVRAGDRHGKGDEAAGVIERRGPGGWVPSEKRQHRCSGQQTISHVLPLF